MKKKLTNPTVIIFLLLASVLIGSNICCTGNAINNEKRTSNYIDDKVAGSEEENTGGVLMLTENNFDQKVSKGIVLVDFTAKWCGPCKRQAPIIDEVNISLAGKASVFKLDIDDCPSIADKFNVQSIPLLIIFKNGNVVSKFVGLTQKNEILDEMERISISK